MKQQRNLHSDDLADQTLICADCRAEFVFSAGEQHWFIERGYHAPKRCLNCRSARRAAGPRLRVEESQP